MYLLLVSNDDLAINESQSLQIIQWIRRRTPQQDADIARPINTDVANMFAIRHTGNNTLSVRQFFYFYFDISELPTFDPLLLCSFVKS